MLSPVTKYITLTLFTLGLPCAALFCYLEQDTSPILIESLESTTADGGKVFNRIQLVKQHGKDIWLMEQSHHGVKATKYKWDKISIELDKTKEIYVAQFKQMINGPETIHHGLPTMDFKVSCFMCHSNGPRAIRPNLESKLAPLSYWNQARVALWNFRIKAYGKVKGVGIGSQKPFRHPDELANKVLDIKTCNLCHKEQGFLARGSLTKQNFMAIKFMVENNHMPPPGFSLNNEEKEKIQNFLP